MHSERMDHIGIAVANLESSKAVFERLLGLKPSGVEEVASQKVKVAMFPLGGTRIELLASTDPEGPIGKFVAKKGEGLHHLAVAVDDIKGCLARLKAEGVALIDETPRPGAHGTLVAFVHPKSACGVLYELVQPGAP